MIVNFPRADISLENLKVDIFQRTEHQIIFMKFNLFWGNSPFPLLATNPILYRAGE